MVRQPRAIVLVIEGLSLPLVGQWVREEYLPTFGRLSREGASGEFTSERVPYEPSTLVTAFSGYSVGEHGCYSYWTTQPSDYRPRIVRSDELGRELLWNRADVADLRFCVINVFGTHPPLPIPGWLITYPTQQTLHACYPSSLLLELSRQRISYAHDVSLWFDGGPRERFVNGALRIDAARAATAEWLWDTYSPDVLVVVFTAVDRLSHVYWHELESGSPFAKTETAIFRAYQQCDTFIRRMVERVNDRTSLLVFSDVGFGPLRAYCSLDENLAKKSFLQEEESRSRVCWSKTVAYESIQGSHGVNINMRGRQKEGIIYPSDYDRVRRDITQALQTIVNPFTGLPLLRDVYCREEIYSGSRLIQAPDLIVEPADERYLPLGERRWAGHVNRQLQSGWHRRETWWGGIGPAFVQGYGGHGCALDVVPTILHMLERPPIVELLGQPLGQRRG